MRNPILLTLFLMMFGLPCWSHAEGTPAYRVVVNAKNPIESLERRFLSDVFLKKARHWPEDGLILPVDLPPDMPSRLAFSEEILGRTVAGIKSYWQQLIFSGQDVPPPELANDEEVLRYVADNPSSVGYVSGTLSGDEANSHGIKIVSVK